MTIEQQTTASYRDRHGIDNRANSALLRIELLINDYSIPSAIRLVKIAQILADEPILTDDSPAAHSVRAQASTMRAVAGAA